MRNTLSVVLLAFVLTLASASSNDISCSPCIDRAQVTLACVHHGTNDDVFWQHLNVAIRQGAIDMGINLLFDPFESDSDSDGLSLEARMADQISSLCETDNNNNTLVDGIFVTLPSTSLLSSVETCASSGIPLIAFNAGTDIAASQGYLYFGQNETEAGLQAGERIAAAGTAIETFCCTNHAPGVDVVTERCSGFERGIASSGRNLNYAEVFVDPLNCTSWTDSVLAACSPTNNGSSWDTVGLYLAGEPNHQCGVEFLQTYNATIAGASDVSDTLYAGMKEGLNVLFGIDQQSYLQGYLPSSFLTLAATNNQIVQNSQIMTGPKFVTEPPTTHQQQCEANDFVVCDTSDCSLPGGGATTTSSEGNLLSKQDGNRSIIVSLLTVGMLMLMQLW